MAYAQQTLQERLERREEFRGKASRWRQTFLHQGEDNVRKDIASRWQQWSEEERVHHSVIWGAGHRSPWECCSVITEGGDCREDGDGRPPYR